MEHKLSTNKENKIEIPEFDNLIISDKNSNSENINHENCYKPQDRKFWCKECVPSCIIEGWSSGNSEIDEFIKDTIYNVKSYEDFNLGYHLLFLEWVPFDKFEDIKPVGEGGFAKVYSAKWLDGRAEYTKYIKRRTWKKLGPYPINVALKRLNESQNMSSEYLNEVFKQFIIKITIIHINLQQF